MHPGNRRNLIERLSTISENLSTPTATFTRRVLRMGAADAYWALVDDIADSYDIVIDRLFKEWHDTFTKSRIETSVNEMLACAASSGGDSDVIRAMLDDLTAFVEAYDEEFTAYVPIGGLLDTGGLPDDGLAFGALRLRAITQPLRNALLARLETTIDRSPASEAQKARSKNELRSLMQRNYSNTVCSEFRAVAEPERAWERAIEATDKVIDPLRFAAANLSPLEHHITIGALENIASIGHIPLVVPSDDSRPAPVTMTHTWPDSFELSVATVQAMRDIGAFTLADVAAAPNATPFERDVLRGLHWFAHSQTQKEFSNKVISLSISLEVLLTPREQDESVTGSIADAVALLIGDTLTERLRWKRETVRLYGVRSGITHGRDPEIKKEDIVELIVMCGTVIRTLAGRRSEFNERSELMRWIEERKLG